MTFLCAIIKDENKEESSSSCLGKSTYIWNSTAIVSECRAIVLAHYDPDKKLEIQCDSSQSGLSSVLIQEGRPVVYVSRALSPTETGYAQNEKVMLAILYAMEKFHQYTFGHHTKVYSDHKPLSVIERKPLHKVLKRLQDTMIQL